MPMKRTASGREVQRGNGLLATSSGIERLVGSIF